MISVPVLIVGAGPAGTATAAALLRAGVDVTVVDRARFPRPKPCGESINPGAVAALDRLGFLPAVMAARPAELQGWCLRDGRGSEVRAVNPSAGLGLDRSTLDAVLLRQVGDAGARVHEGVRVDRVSGVPEGGLVVRGTDSAGRPLTWHTRLLVGADGLRSVVARRLGLVRRGRGAARLSLTCHVRGIGPSRNRGQLFLTDGLTVGLAPIGQEDGWNATVVLHRPTDRRRAGRDRVGAWRTGLARAAFAWRHPPTVVGGPWTSGPFHVAGRSAVGDGVILVGDAAGYFDPLTGQGICQALRSAELAAPVLLEALRTGRGRARDLVVYDRELRRMRNPIHRFQQTVDYVMRHRRIRPRTLGLLGRHPAWADRIWAVAGDVAPVRSLVPFGASFKEGR